ncbi:MAG: NUDIX hydrolase [bacterium]|nr:NUDIX hydrolase [bacterium]
MTPETPSLTENTEIRFMIVLRGIVIRDDGKILMLHRKNDPSKYNPDGWEFPGGRQILDPKNGYIETTDGAFEREVFDETGLDVLTISRLEITIFDFKREGKFKNTAYYEKVRITRLNGGEIFLDQEDHDDARWVTPKKALKTLSLTREVRMALAKFGPELNRFRRPGKKKR